MKRQNILNLLTLSIIVAILVIRAAIFLDPDFGWHLRMGEIITVSGIPKTDPFSYSMPSFPFVDHEWLTNLIIYKLYSNFGIKFLCFIPAVLIIGTLIFASRNKIYLDFKKGRFIFIDSLHKKIKIDLGSFNIIFLLSFAVLFSFSGVRPQVLSWFLFALLLKIIFIPKIWDKYKYTIPALILLWSNLHGSFAISVITLSIVISVRTLARKKVDPTEATILIFSFLTTLVNPYGTRLWGEVFMQISDSNLRWSIAEWMPSTLLFHIPLILLFTISVYLVYRYKNQYRLEELVLYLFLLYEALSSRRHMPFWIIYSLSMNEVAIEKFYDEIKKIKYGANRFSTIYKFGFIFVISIIFLQMIIDFMGTFALSEKNYYPSLAVIYIRNNLSNGQVFSTYNWGGYLIWKLPEKKVFIDGRMPSWRWKAPQGEADWAFEEYDKLISGEYNQNEIFKKYNIDTVLLEQEENETIVEHLSNTINKFIANLPFVKHKVDFREQLVKNGWQKVYEDKISVIYKR